MSESDFVCERDDLFERLEDLDWFYGFVCHQYGQISFAGTGLRPTLSRYNISEAHASYMYDVMDLEERELAKGASEQIKRAAFLSYWLRRASPINGVYGDVDVVPRFDSLDPVEDFFLKYGNEICAFDLGFRICRYFMSVNPDAEDLQITSLRTHDGIRHAFRLDNLRSYRLSRKYVKDCSHLLKEKNVSPHSLYLIYLAIFMFAESL